MDIQTYLASILTFLNAVVAPFLLAVAFVIFLWNAFRFFILGGGNTEDQDKAKSLATWSISAFIIIVSLWGIVNMLVSGFGFGRTMGITPDYIESKDGYIPYDP